MTNVSAPVPRLVALAQRPGSLEPRQKEATTRIEGIAGQRTVTANGVCLFLLIEGEGVPQTILSWLSKSCHYQFFFFFHDSSPLSTFYLISRGFLLSIKNAFLLICPCPQQVSDRLHLVCGLWRLGNEYLAHLTCRVSRFVQGKRFRASTRWFLPSRI